MAWMLILRHPLSRRAPKIATMVALKQLVDPYVLTGLLRRHLAHFAVNYWLVFVIHLGRCVARSE